ncbi:hypothetical protein ONZ45_g17270 [Pleurotus djamor]|nr:hypothetical protein ONZ45_g17270 [Pleurotus djamor]
MDSQSMPSNQLNAPSWAEILISALHNQHSRSEASLALEYVDENQPPSIPDAPVEQTPLLSHHPITQTIQMALELSDDVEETRQMLEALPVSVLKSLSKEITTALLQKLTKPGKFQYPPPAIPILDNAPTVTPSHVQPPIPDDHSDHTADAEGEDDPEYGV